MTRNRNPTPPNPEIERKVQRTLKMLRVQKALRRLRDFQVEQERLKAEQVQEVVRGIQDQDDGDTPV